jgi:hypothetical protein
MDKKTRNQIQYMKDNLYKAFVQASADFDRYDISPNLGHVAEAYAALVQAEDVLDLREYRRLGGLPRSVLLK